VAIFTGISLATFIRGRSDQ